MADVTSEPQVPSDTVLDEIPARALKFFGAVSSNLYIRSVLAKRGYDDAIHERGWSLVLQSAGFRRGAQLVMGRPEAMAAVVELDAWDEPNFRAARGALVTLPAQRDFLFEDLTAQTGIAAVASVTTFLNRLDELEKGADRKGTRKADQAAVEKLAARGIGPDVRKHLRGLLAQATNSPDSASLEPDEAKEAKLGKQKEEQRAAKIELWALFTEWSEIARADITRRDYLIMLGIAKRKKTEKKGKGKGKGGDGEGQGPDK